MEKNKLKYLFGYFKAFGANEAQTRMQIDWDSINDWTEDFDLYKDKDGKTFTKSIVPIRSIIQIIEELISENMRDIHYMTNLEWDEYFTLYISIFPKENRLVFETSSKVKMWEKESLDLKLSDLRDKNYDFIKNIQNGENPISGGEKVTKIDYSFDGYYDYYDVFDLELDDELLYMGTEISESFWDVVDNIISNRYGKYWAEEDSVKGDIRIWGDDIFMKFNYGFQDWQDSESKIEIKI